MTTKTWMRCLALLFAGTLALTGCTGDDGAQGPQGEKGDKGDTGEKGDKGDTGEPPVAMVESCDGCHNGIATKHAERGQLVVSNVAVALANADADLAVTFNIKVDGILRNDFTNKYITSRTSGGVTTITWGYRWLYQSTAPVGGVRASYDGSAGNVESLSSGNYRVTFPGWGTAGAAPLAAGTALVVRLNNGSNDSPMATIVAEYGTPARPLAAAVSDQACMNCHGEFVFREMETDGTHHHGVNPAGVSACVVCHNRNTDSETRLGTAAQASGTRLMGYVHGIHNSHNMPDGVYSRNGSTSASSQFSVGFPGYMQNCSTCHDTAASQAAAASAPISFKLCISCHDGWDGFGMDATTLPLHQGLTAASDCTTCHNDTGTALSARNTVGEFHNGLMTERNGLVWDGADQSVLLGKQIVMTVDSVAISGTTMTVTWSATQNGTAVDPCNTDFAVGPVFLGQTANSGTGLSSSNMNLLRAYAIGNDWVNPAQAASPGQPNSTGLTIAPATNPTTTYASNVATSVLTLPAGEPPAGAAKGTVALQGKPQVRFPAGAPAREFIQVRSPSPTREFAVADGAVPATLRRAIVDFAKCEACHLGSMYQHGGNRVDSIELCVTCHNPASNEKNNRVNMGVTAAEAYDGQAGQTYDLRTMVHAIHSAGETGKPLVFYRTNGAYFFGSKDALAAATTWPGTGCQVVAGSGAPSTATGTQCDAANTTAVTKNHNFIEVHYPRALNDCSACHVDGAVEEMPNPTMAVAVTMEDAGAAPWNELADDVLMGPSAASCMTCHQSSDPVEQFIYRTHAYGNGWTPSTFEGGRQALIDAVTP